MLDLIQRAVLQVSAAVSEPQHSDLLCKSSLASHMVLGAFGPEQRRAGTGAPEGAVREAKDVEGCFFFSACVIVFIRVTPHFYSPTQVPPKWKRNAGKPVAIKDFKLLKKNPN